VSERVRSRRARRSAVRRRARDRQLDRALTFWRSVKATRYLRSGESLIETPAKKSASTKR